MGVTTTAARIDPLDLLLSESGVVVTKHKPDVLVHKKSVPQPPEIVTLPVGRIVGIRVGWTQSASEIPVGLLFSEKTSMGKKVSFNAAPSAVLTLVRWQQQVEAKK